MTPSEALQAAIKAVGGVAAELARRVGVTPQALGQWEQAPPERCLAIERATNGAVTRYQLRPDVFGDPPPNGHPPPLPVAPRGPADNGGHGAAVVVDGGE